jgi:hypothetical protein
MFSEERRQWRGSQEVAMPAARFVHPEFGFFCPTPRLRRLVRAALVGVAFAAVGIAVLRAAHDPDGIARLDGGSSAEISPQATVAPVATAEARPGRSEATATEAVKFSCGDDTGAHVDGKCAPVKARKARMVRVANDRPAIATMPLGRSPAVPASAIESASTASAPDSRQGDPSPSKSAQAAPADAAPAAESQRPVAASKKSRSTAQNRRRDQADDPSWREVRVDDWSARGYGPSERSYQRGGYGRQGFFW